MERSRCKLCKKQSAEVTVEPEMGRKVSEIERAHYLKDPYKFTRTLLVEGRSGRLTRPKEIVDLKRLTVTLSGV